MDTPTTPGAAARDAVQTYPELADVAALRSSGWQFMPLHSDGELAGFAGFRHVSEDTVDALYVFDRHVCRAVRLVADAPGTPGGTAWEYNGPLAAAISQLRALPVPPGPSRI